MTVLNLTEDDIINSVKDYLINEIACQNYAQNNMVKQADYCENQTIAIFKSLEIYLGFEGAMDAINKFSEKYYSILEEEVFTSPRYLARN